MDNGIKWLGRVPGGIIGGIFGWTTSRSFIGVMCGIIAGAFAGEYMIQLLACRYSSKKSIQYAEMEQKWRNDLLEGILILSADIIKTDGKQQQYQLQYVKEFLSTQFGEDEVSKAMRKLDFFLNQQKINFYQALSLIQGVDMYALFRYLIILAIADGEFSREERVLIEKIGIGMNLPYNEIKSIIASIYSEFTGGYNKDDSEKTDQGNGNTPTAYVILEIKTTATNDEVRAAYRRKALECHPDRIASRGIEAQKVAAENFRRIHDAYETIKRERGMN